jgi:putative aldouronate transport system permease protein
LNRATNQAGSKLDTDDFHPAQVPNFTATKGEGIQRMKTQTSIFQTSPPDRSLKARRLGLSIWNHRFYYLLLLPAFFAVLLFSYFPLYGIQIAFKDYKGSLGLGGSEWVGFKYFKDFFQSYNCWTLIKNTFALSVYSFLAGFPLPILLALLLNEVRGRYKSFTQTVLYAPHFISLVVLAGMIIAMLSPSIGSINAIIKMLGGKSVYFMSQPSAFRHIYVWSGIWQDLGWNSVIYIAALSAVDPQLHEAAIMDGASKLQRIWHINLPTILPTIVIMFILTAGQLATVGQEKVLLLQNDLNLDVSEVISTYVYKRGILHANYSFSTAIGLLNNAVNVFFLLIANWISSRVSDTSLF